MRIKNGDVFYDPSLLGRQPSPVVKAVVKCADGRACGKVGGKGCGKARRAVKCVVRPEVKGVVKQTEELW